MLDPGNEQEHLSSASQRGAQAANQEWGKLFLEDSGSPQTFSVSEERVTDDHGSVRELSHVAIGPQLPLVVEVLAGWLTDRYISPWFASTLGRVIQHRIVMVGKGINLVDHDQIKSSPESQQLMRRCQRDAPPLPTLRTSAI